MKLYIDHYTKIHKGKTIAFAVKEGVLRVNYSFIIEDLNFLTRKGINVILYHNIGKNLGNNTFLRENIEIKAPNVKLERVSPNIDLYEHILSIKLDVDKLIILERQYLISKDGDRINTISTKKLSVELGYDDLLGLGIGNVNFRKSLLLICKAIEKGYINRVHILPGGRKHSIKHELFSLEGVGTLVGNDFGKPSISEANIGDEDIVKGILNSNKGNKYLKLRSKKYILDNISNFRIATIDGIPVGCVQIIKLDAYTVELGALSVIHTFLSLKVGISLINYVISHAKIMGFDLISLTNNTKLQKIYFKFGFEEDIDGFYKERSKKSPGVNLYYLND